MDAISIPYYGSAIPQSVLSKCGWLVPFANRPILARFMSTFVSLALLDPPAALSDGCAVGTLIKAAGPVSATFFCIGAVLLFRRKRLAFSLPLLFLGYLAFYLSARGRLDFSWYGIPSGLAYWATCWVGLAAVVGRMTQVGRRERLARLGIVAPIVFLTSTSIWCWRTARLRCYRSIMTSYEAAGKLIDATADADASVLIDEAGMMGYAANRHVVDIDGIVSPRMTEIRRSLGWRCSLEDIVRYADPDFIAVSWAQLNRLREEDAGTWIRAHYDTLGALPGHVVLRKSKPKPGSEQDVE